ncbi:PepSY-associated TM helix domain-containing protein [Poseidonibacter lekithochrous]|uniref:PepSY-associated TM helix domain-containing protein n=1 Tax=Poseidonibacter lekithochrous TaxID=1904463 RepID=UPI0008FC40BB|nr:PepSY-associated TM helix domain-containing protein [Poseidonibacter lekithochrous]QKJ24224.1 PepSY domain-containing membrane protein [Poseidonibacter lekithochrous]
MKENKSKLFKQRLFRIHAAVGILVSSFMYISIFFGVFTIFLPYIKTWEKPSRYIEDINIMNIDYNSMINEVLKNPDFPKDDILINLPGNMGDPAVVITHRFAKEQVFNPKTNEKINNETKEQTGLADFINHLHYGRPLKSIGMIFFGFIATATLALILTGLILIIKMKFKNKGKNQQSIFSKVHVKIFSWIFFPLILITLSGALMNVGLISAGPMSQIITKGEAKSIDAVVGTVLFAQNKASKKANKPAKMKDIKNLLIKAQEINPQLIFKQIKLVNWNDKNAQVEIIGYNPYKPFFNGGIFNKPTIILSAVNADLIKNQKVMDKVWTVFVAEIIFFLHFLFGIDIFSRVLIAVLMILSAIAIGFGTMLFLEKKAKKFDDKITFYHWIGKFSLASMIGIIPSIAMLFVLQWMLPFDLEDRLIWQQGIFYNIWLFTLFWSFYKINSYEVAKNFFFIGGLLFIISVMLHLIFLNIPILEFFNLSSIFTVDISLVLLGIILIYISEKLPKNRDEAKLFWTLKKQKDNK